MSDMEDRLDKAGFKTMPRSTGTSNPPRTNPFPGLSVMTAPARGGEAFGMHVIEAMTRGIPVVQPRTGAYPELLENSAAGLLYEPDTPGGLANALRELLTDPALARRLGEQGYRHAREHFTVERMAREMTTLYETVAAH